MNAPTRMSRDDLKRFIAKGDTPQAAKRRRIEAAIQKAFAEWCKFCLPKDVLWFSIPNERKPEDMGDLMAMGLRPGAADICIIYGGNVYFIEFKTKDGPQSEAQERFEEDAGRAGAEYAICRSSEQAKDQLTAWGIPHREAA